MDYYVNEKFISPSYTIARAAPPLPLIGTHATLFHIKDFLGDKILPARRAAKKRQMTNWYEQRLPEFLTAAGLGYEKTSLITTRDKKKILAEGVENHFRTGEF